MSASGKARHGGEGLGIVLDGEPVEGEVRAVGQHRLAGTHGGEGVIVRAERRPVRGLAHRDVEGVVVVAGGEHRARHLEQHEVERGPEFLRQMGLDQRRADGAEIVAEPDADARVLARLASGSGRAGGMAGLEMEGAWMLELPSPAAPASSWPVPFCASSSLASAAGMSSGLTRPWTSCILPSLLTVTMQPETAMCSGRNTARASTAASMSARRVSIVSPSAASSPVHSSSSMLTSSSWRTCRRSISAFSSSVVCPGVGCTRAEAGEVRPAHLDACLGPLPVARELVRRGLEPVRGELAKKIGVLEPDAPFVLVGEEVAVDDAAGPLVGFDADEGGDRRRGGHPVLGEHAFDLPGGGSVALLADPFPDRELARAVDGDGEGLQRLKVDGALAVGVEDLRRGVAKAQALLDGALRHAETGGDIGDGGAGIGERAEGLHLVGRVHRHAHHVLGEGELAVDRAVADDPAGDGMVGLENAVPGEVVEGGEAAGAGDDGVVLAAVLAGSDGACHEVLEQPVGGDRGLELGESGLAGLGPADVGGRALQAVERDGSDDGIVHGVLRNAWIGRRPDPSTATGLTPRRTRSISPRRAAGERSETGQSVPCAVTPRNERAHPPVAGLLHAGIRPKVILLIHESPLTDALFLLVSKSDEVTTT